MAVWLGRLLLACAAVLLVTQHWLAAAVAGVAGLWLSGLLQARRGGGDGSSGSGSSGSSSWDRPIDYDQDSGNGSDDGSGSSSDNGGDGGSSDGGGSSD